MQFSVIIPAKNAAKFLAAAIESALSQETTLEVIVVNDGSTDETVQVADEIRRRDDRLTIISNPVSVGVSAARNQAIAVAKGEWIAVLDADDEFLAGRLSILIQEAERRTLNMFADNLALRSEAGKDLGIAFSETELHDQNPVSLDLFLLHDIPGLQPMGIGYCKLIVKREFLVKTGVRYNEDISCAEDFLFYTECLMAGAQLGFSKTAGYLYTVRTGGHGTLFNLQVSHVNRLITKAARKLKPSAIPILQTRQHAIDYDAFTKLIRTRHYYHAATSLHRLSPLFIMRRGAVSAVKRAKRLVMSKKTWVRSHS